MKVVEMMSTVEPMEVLKDECSGDDKVNGTASVGGKSMSTVGVMSVVETMKVLKMMEDDNDGHHGSRTSKQSRAIKDVRRDW